MQEDKRSGLWYNMLGGDEVLWDRILQATNLGFHTRFDFVRVTELSESGHAGTSSSLSTRLINSLIGSALKVSTHSSQKLHFKWKTNTNRHLKILTRFVGYLNSINRRLNHVSIIREVLEIVFFIRITCTDQFLTDAGCNYFLFTINTNYSKTLH